MSLFEAVRHISAREAAERAGIPIHLRGGKAWTCCPIHGEQTPSMRLYEEPERGWCCFGCHRGGDAVRLYQELYRLEPLDAAKALAAAFGIPVDDQSGPPPKPAPTVWNLKRALEQFRSDHLAALRGARTAADADCRSRAAADGPGAWDDPVFVRALRARAEADVVLDRLEGAPLDELAALMDGGTAE